MTDVYISLHNTWNEHVSLNTPHIGVFFRKRIDNGPYTLRTRNYFLYDACACLIFWCWIYEMLTEYDRNIESKLKLIFTVVFREIQNFPYFIFETNNFYFNRLLSTKMSTNILVLFEMVHSIHACIRACAFSFFFPGNVYQFGLLFRKLFH